ncbi:MAG: hypothetical protein ACPHAN_04545 [Pseudomonadales bacterium]
MRFVKAVLVLLMFWLAGASLLPVLGWNLYLPFQVEELDLTGVYLRLVTIKSAAFMTMVYFIFNYLRHRRPLSSVAPLLVFSNFIVGFGVFFMVRYTHLVLIDWLVLTLLAILSVMLFFENEKESRTIFKDDW